MRILTILLVMLATVFIYSCGEDDVKTYNLTEFSQEFANSLCEPAFTCTEAEDNRFKNKYATQEECEEKLPSELKIELEGKCPNFSEKVAYKYITCLNSLTCSNFENYKGADGECETEDNDLCK